MAVDNEDVARQQTMTSPTPDGDVEPGEQEEAEKAEEDADVDSCVWPNDGGDIALAVA